MSTMCLILIAAKTQLRLIIISLSISRYKSTSGLTYIIKSNSATYSKNFRIFSPVFQNITYLCEPWSF